VKRIALLVAVALIGGLVAVLLPPIHQDLAYHDFADRRAILGIPYGLNVLSNVGFLLVGVWAFVRVARASPPPWERVAGLLFAAGLVLTGLGSAWYHAVPSNATLVWDRLPLSALFPTVFAVAIGDRVSQRAGRLLLVPLVAGAIASVLWWRRTDDLRAYALAQFLPMLLIPLMLALFDGRRPMRPLLAAVVVYAAGKLAEVMDGAVLAFGGLVSGHTLKHLLAAIAAIGIVQWLAPARAEQ
jgi:predicted membrane channel-forming protein YqfA (hemolysin III family)